MSDLEHLIQTILARYYPRLKKSVPPDNLVQELVCMLQDKYKRTSRYERKDILVCGDKSNLRHSSPIELCGNLNIYKLIYDWPPNDGFLESPEVIELHKNDLFDRIGPNTGVFVSPILHENEVFGISARSLPYYFLEKNIISEPSYHRFKVIREFSTLEKIANKNPMDIYRLELKKSKGLILKGKVAPHFGQTGNGDQIKLPLSINMLLDLGMIKEIQHG